MRREGGGVYADRRSYPRAQKPWHSHYQTIPSTGAVLELGATGDGSGCGPSSFSEGGGDRTAAAPGMARKALASRAPSGACRAVRSTADDASWILARRHACSLVKASREERAGRRGRPQALCAERLVPYPKLSFSRRGRSAPCHLFEHDPASRGGRGRGSWRASASAAAPHVVSETRLRHDLPVAAEPRSARTGGAKGRNFRSRV